MTVVACLGDSITEGSPYWDSRRRSGDPEGQWEHWAGLLHPELEFRNHGIWGERTDEIALRFDEAVAHADRLIVQGGINDLAQGAPVEAAAANLQALVERAHPARTAGRRLRRAPLEQRLAAARGFDPRAQRAHPFLRRAAPALPRHARGSRSGRGG